MLCFSGPHGPQGPKGTQGEQGGNGPDGKEGPGGKINISQSRFIWWIRIQSSLSKSIVNEEVGRVLYIKNVFYLFQDVFVLDHASIVLFPNKKKINKKINKK